MPKARENSVKSSHILQLLPLFGVHWLFLEIFLSFRLPHRALMLSVNHSLHANVDWKCPRAIYVHCRVSGSAGFSTPFFCLPKVVRSITYFSSMHGTSETQAPPEGRGRLSRVCTYCTIYFAYFLFGDEDAHLCDHGFPRMF